MPKVFRTIDEQLDILRGRGLSVPDDVVEEAKDFLIKNNYYRIHNNAAQVLSNYLHGITIVRNLCAHDSRLFNRLFIRKPDLNKREQELLNKDLNGNPDNSKLFGYILIIKRLLTDSEFDEFKSRIQELCKKYPFVDMRYYGFCDNWENAI